jgi:hypothetical protein
MCKNKIEINSLFLGVWIGILFQMILEDIKRYLKGKI